MANRFTQYQQQNYIDPYVAPPIDFMYQEFQQARKANAEAQADMSTTQGLMDLKAGRYGSDLLKEYNQKYNTKIEELTNRLMNNPKDAVWIAPEIKKLQNQMKSDDLRKQIETDYLYTQEEAKKAIGDVPYYFKTHSNWKPGDVVTADAYGIITDKGIDQQLFNNITKFQEDLESTINEGDTITDIGPDGKIVQYKNITKTQVAKLRERRLSKYLDDFFDNTETSESMLFRYRKALDNLNITDPETINYFTKSKNPDAVNWRKNIYNQTVESNKQLAYRKRTVQEEVKEIQSKTNPNAGAGTKAKTEKQPEELVTYTAQVAAGTFNDFNGGSVRSITQVGKSINHYSDQIIKSAGNIKELLINEGMSDGQIQNLLDNIDKIEIDDDNNLYFPDNLMTEEKKKELENSDRTETKTLAQAISNYKINKLELQNTQGFEDQLKKTFNVDKYNLNTIIKAEEEHSKILKRAYDNIAVRTGDPILGAIMASFATLGEAFLDLDMTKLSHLALDDQEYLLKAQEDYFNAVKKELKGTNEGKMFEALETFNNRKSQVKITEIPKDKIDVALPTIVNKIIDGSIELYNPYTNQTARTAEGSSQEDIAQIFYDKESKLRKDVTLGYFIDPSQNARGYISVGGKTYEYPLEQYDLTQPAIMPEDNNRTNYDKILRQFNQTNFATKGQDISFNIDNIRVDGIKSKITQEGFVEYSYKDPINNRTMITTDPDKIIQTYVSYYQNIENLNNVINQLETSGNLSPKAKMYLDNLKRERDKLGKQSPQSQGNRLRL
jgi:hypothetical protein